MSKERKKMSSSDTASIPPPAKAGGGGGGNTWIYLLFIVVGLVFVVATIVSLVIAIVKRPKQAYISNPKIPASEVFVVLFDETPTSGHKNTGGTYDQDQQKPVEAYNTSSFDFFADSNPSYLYDLINAGTQDDASGMLTQIFSKTYDGKYSLATKAQCEQFVTGASFKHYTDDNNSTAVEFLIAESFPSGDGSTYDFYKLDGDNKLTKSSNGSSPTTFLGTDTKPRLAVAIYGPKPYLGDFITRQEAPVAPPIAYNKGPEYGNGFKDIQRPSFTFKATWLATDGITPVITVKYRIMPFNASVFKNEVEDKKWNSKDSDGRLKGWTNNYQ